MHDDLQRLWFAGLPVSGRVALDERDRLRLRRLVRSRRTLAGAAFLGGPAAIALLGFTVAISTRALRRDLGASAETAFSAAVVVGILFTLFAVLPVSILVARDAWRQYRVAVRAQRGGALYRCRGPIADVVVDRRTWERIVDSGLLRGAELELDVFDDSGLLWRIGGVEVDRWIQLPRGVTTSTPEYAAIASRWTKPIETPTGVIDYNRRGLSDGELAELRGSAPSVGVLRGTLIAAVNLLALANAAEVLRGNGEPLQTLLALVIAVWADVELASLVNIRRRIDADAREGWVAIVKSKADEPEAPREGAVVEYLPRTGLEWTVDGLPAPWRRIAARRPVSPSAS
ncbi:MAG: hypothetical protein NDJ92_08725 [Thermoanaerobaculia bacterium]|nr:hypothetical protein [Thermoanaerobaculia bacterium]